MIDPDLLDALAKICEHICSSIDAEEGSDDDAKQDDELLAAIRALSQKIDRLAPENDKKANDDEELTAKARDGYVEPSDQPKSLKGAQAAARAVFRSRREAAAKQPTG